MKIKWTAINPEMYRTIYDLVQKGLVQFEKHEKSLDNYFMIFGLKDSDIPLLKVSQENGKFSYFLVNICEWDSKSC